MKIENIVKVIEKEFMHGDIKQISSKDMLEKLEAKGYEHIDIDDALDEAERRKIIAHGGGFYKWVDPSLREVEKVKTQRHFQVLAEIYKEGKIEFLPREDLIVALREREFDNEEIRRILIEAERDYVLRFVSRSFSTSKKWVRGCIWIPPKDRKREANAERDQREWFEKQLEKYEFEDERWG